MASTVFLDEVATNLSEDGFFDSDDAALGDYMAQRWAEKKKEFYTLGFLRKYILNTASRTWQSLVSV